MTPEVTRALFSPRTIALVGASDDPAKVAGRPLTFLRQHGFGGEIWPINPRRETVQGEPAFASLADLPGTPEHAYILLPADAAIEAAAECASAGVLVVSVLADGFSEAGDAGMRRQQRLLAAVSGSQTRLLGPQCLGVVNVSRKIALTANAAFAEPEIEPGGLMVASHSGSMLGALLSRGVARGLGFAHFVSFGNEADLSIGEVCHGAIHHPDVTAFLLFLETIRQPEQFAVFARAAWDAGKPVVAYRLGRSAAAAELTVSHTGAMLSDGRAIDAFLADCGVASIHALESLLEAPPLLHIPRAAAPAGVAVVATTGGGGAMVVDQLARAGAPLARFSEAFKSNLIAADLPAPEGPLLDVTLAGTRPEVMGKALDLLAADPDIALTVAVVGSSARFQPQLAVQALVDGAARGGNIAAFLNPNAPESLARLSAAGMPAFRTAEGLADCVRAWMRHRPPRISPRPLANLAGNPTPLDESRSLALLSKAGLPCVSTILVEASETLPDLPFPYPVVAKGIAPGVAHKTERGLVRLDLPDAASLQTAIADLCAQPDCKQVLIAPMVWGVGEVLLGFRRDPVVGPVVMLSPGGVLAELYDDRTVRTAPVDDAIAREMIAELPGLQPLTGYRNLPPGDVDALAAAIVTLSRLAAADDPVIHEAEVNPLIVRAPGEGVVAVDALVVTT